MAAIKCFFDQFVVTAGKYEIMKFDFCSLSHIFQLKNKKKKVVFLDQFNVLEKNIKAPNQE